MLERGTAGIYREESETDKHRGCMRQTDRQTGRGKVDVKIWQINLRGDKVGLRREDDGTKAGTTRRES